LFALATFFDAEGDKCRLGIAHDVFLSVVSPTAGLDAVRRGRRPGRVNRS
jgi:hypothetical protein